MTSISSTIHQHSVKLARLTAIVLARIAIVLGMVCGMVAVGLACTEEPQGVAPAPAPTPIQQAPVAAGDGFADHHFFNEDATLDTSRFDDLRETPESQCLRADGVMTPAQICVAGVKVWEDEITPEQWDTLVGEGYIWDLDDRDSLWIPAEMVILDGENGEHVLAVHLDAPLTPYLVG
jgi:hypothetical protein